ncbi:hypothetical protein I546_6580 [Mycobacterium kansasii 732]|nr:hypothetical protein I546_6580 [Mycobacterium kansasii 732]
MGVHHGPAGRPPPYSCLPFVARSALVDRSDPRSDTDRAAASS